MAFGKYDTSGNSNYADGNVLSAADFDSMNGGVAPPIGSIVGWLKSMTGAVTLPASWKECDGSVVSDADSPLNGQTLPNLNSTGRFLKGNATSGTVTAYASDTLTSGNNTASANQYKNTAGGTAGAYEALMDHVHTMVVAPPYYTVVWVIRIK